MQLNISDEDLDFLKESLKFKKEELAQDEDKIKQIEAKKLFLKKQLVMLYQTNITKLSPLEITDILMKVKVDDLLVFLRETYGFKPEDLSVYHRMSCVSGKNLAEIGVGLIRLKIEIAAKTSDEDL